MSTSSTANTAATAEPAKTARSAVPVPGKAVRRGRAYWYRHSRTDSAEAVVARDRHEFWHLHPLPVELAGGTPQPGAVKPGEALAVAYAMFLSAHIIRRSDAGLGLPLSEIVSTASCVFDDDDVNPRLLAVDFDVAARSREDVGDAAFQRFVQASVGAAFKSAGARNGLGGDVTARLEPGA